MRTSAVSIIYPRIVLLMPTLRTRKHTKTYPHIYFMKPVIIVWHRAPLKNKQVEGTPYVVCAGVLTIFCRLRSTPSLPKRT